MPVSVSNTAYGIINDAMHDAGLLQDGTEPNSEQLATGMRRLCDVINTLQLDGLKLFLNAEYTIPIVAGTDTYLIQDATLIPSKHLAVIEGRVQSPDGVVRPLEPIAWEEWNRLSRTSDGAIVGYFTDKQATTFTVKVWNMPDASEALNDLILVIRKQAPNPFNLETDVSFPPEWRMALRWGLADDISTGQPSTIMDRCLGKFQYYKNLLENWDVEDAPTRFAPDFRGYQSGSFS